jgi:ABC-2 type transport system permease protein
MFFLSSALYPVWKIQESSPVLATLCRVNPFTHAVELIRFSLYLTWNPVSLLVVVLATVLFFAAALWGYEPARTRPPKGD